MLNNGNRDLENSGSWRTKPNGKLEYRFIYYDDYGRTRQKSVVADTREECFDKARRFLKNVEGVKHDDLEDASLVDILERKFRMDYEMHFTGEQGYATNLANLQHLKKSYIGDKPVKDVTKGQIQAYLKGMTKYSDSTISKFYMHLRQGFRIAEEKGIIRKNPMNDSELRRPRSIKRGREVHALTVAEQKRLTDFLQDKAYRYGSNDYRVQIMISLLSGLRMGEVNALHPEDIDLLPKDDLVDADLSDDDDKNFDDVSDDDGERGRLTMQRVMKNVKYNEREAGFTDSSDMDDLSDPLFDDDDDMEYSFISNTRRK